MWEEITYPFPNFNGCTIEVWEWISHFFPHFTGHVITYSCQDLSYQLTDPSSGFSWLYYEIKLSVLKYQTNKSSPEMSNKKVSFFLNDFHDNDISQHFLICQLTSSCNLEKCETLVGRIRIKIQSIGEQVKKWYHISIISMVEVLGTAYPCTKYEWGTSGIVAWQQQAITWTNIGNVQWYKIFIISGLTHRG